MPEQIRIGILKGGISSEREISLKSGQAVEQALKQSHPNVLSFDYQTDDPDVLRQWILENQIDLVFSLLHGRLGEDGFVHQILEKDSIPFVGSSSKACQLTFDKSLTQKFLKNQGILVPDFVVLNDSENIDLNGLIQRFGDQMIVKPSSQGSSVGVSLVKESHELKHAIDKAFEYDKVVLVEEYIQGKEMTVGILGQRALPVVGISPSQTFFDLQCKYDGTTQYDVPAKISDSLSDKMQAIALEVFQKTNCRDLARVDFMVDENDQPYVLEINTIPGFTETSLLPKAAQLVGINFQDLCWQLVETIYNKAYV